MESRPTKRPAALLVRLYEHAETLHEVGKGDHVLTQAEASDLALDLVEAIKAFRRDYEKVLELKAKAEISLQDAAELQMNAKLHLEKAREKLNAIAG